MRVGVVAYELEGEATGVGRYLEGLLSGVSPSADWTFRLFCHGRPFEHPLFDRPDVEAHFAGREGRPWLWEQIELPELLARHRLDLVFSPAYSLPGRLRVPGVVTLHDLSFERLPGEFGPRERWRRRLLARSAARRAARVLVDQAAIAREVAALYGLPRLRIGVVPLAVDARFQPSHDPAADRRELLALGVEPPYWLFLGSLLERRRLDLVLAALAPVAAQRPELRLVLAGANRLRRPESLGEQVQALGLGGRVQALGYVPEGSLLPLYRGAELAFYLSEYEGYGLPPLEALASGTAVVVGPGLALDDLWPGYPLRAAELSVGAVQKVVTQAADSAWLGGVAEEGRRRVAALTWAHAATLWQAELERAVAP
ncbi:MAG: glycosyltransferase [Thermoanaerobaculia bacterium]